MANPADILTARMLMRITENGTVNPAQVPQTRTHLTQIGMVFYPNVSDMISTLGATWYGGIDKAPDGAECVGRAVIALVTQRHSVGLLTALARAEMVLAADADLLHINGVLRALGVDAAPGIVPAEPVVQALAYVASETM